MKISFFIVVFLAVFPVYSKSPGDSLLVALNKTIRDKDQYVEIKLQRINRHHEQLRITPEKKANTRFRILQSLSEDYKTFIYDSAFTYSRKLLDVAFKLRDSVKISYAKIQLAFVLLSSGMFKETIDSLRTLHIAGMPDSLRVRYYAVMARTYYDLGDYGSDRHFTPAYIKMGSAYVDSALQLYDPKSYDFLYLTALKNLKSGNTVAVSPNLLYLLNHYPLTAHQLAVTASTLSFFYIEQNEPERAIPLLARAAIADLRTATKETAAMSALAELLYKRGEIAPAYLYIQDAMEDAIFYGARQRKVQVGSILPVIAAAHLNNVEGQRRLWLIYSVTLTVLALLVATFAISTVRQLKKRKIAEKALQEANKIKEEYIGYYFNINSEYLGKIEAFKKAVEMKLLTKKTDDIKFIVNNINLKKEREDLYVSFDKVFLKLFPDFVTIFNSYFKAEDRIVLKEGQLLNTELRIFALIRMGIHDPEKIAKILDYSINTIYNYKARVKSKSLLRNEDFEKKIMEIQTL